MSDVRDEPTTRLSARGPFSGVRALLWWLFWIGLVLAIVLGATGVASAPTVPLTVGYLVTIGAGIFTLYGALWLVDVVLAYLKG
jgi:hypothetical protein